MTEAGEEGLEAFVTAIEAALRAHRGVEHVLSPRDFAIARGWHEARIPLAIVLVGVDLAFEADPSASSLASLTGADVAVQADALLHQEQFDVVTV